MIYSLASRIDVKGIESLTLSRDGTQQLKIHTSMKVLNIVWLNSGTFI